MNNSSSTATVRKAIEGKFDHEAILAEKLLFFLEYALLAPSSHNTQPWMFKIVGDDTIEVYADDSRWLKIADADKRELYISVGCALENLLIAAEYHGYDSRVNYFPNPLNENLVATVHFNQSAEHRILPESLKLFPSVELITMNLLPSRFRLKTNNGYRIAVGKKEFGSF